jgi:putative acetyltransferase
MVIREAEAADHEAIRALTDEAFGGSSEAALVDRLRAENLAAVELVATEGPAVLGHILFSRLSVVSGERPVRALAAAPTAVIPHRQRRGIGGRLVREGPRHAAAHGWEAVFVLGHPAYYPRFGFSAALARKFKAPFAGEAFMALELVPGALSVGTGRVVYPDAFGAPD